MCPGFSSQDLAGIRRSLLTLRERLRMQLPHDLLEVSLPQSGLPARREERETDIVTSLRHAEAERVLAQLTRVEETLNRLDSEIFGRCTECYQEIDEESLRQDLTAGKCAACRKGDEAANDT